MNHLITVPHSVMVVLGKMRDEIGSLNRKAEDGRIAYDILVAEHADLKLKYDTLQFEFGAMAVRLMGE